MKLFANVHAKDPLKMYSAAEPKNPLTASKTSSKVYAKDLQQLQMYAAASQAKAFTKTYVCSEADRCRQPRTSHTGSERHAVAEYQSAVPWCSKPGPSAADDAAA